MAGAAAHRVPILAEAVRADVDDVLVASYRLEELALLEDQGELHLARVNDLDDERLGGLEVLRAKGGAIAALAKPLRVIDPVPARGGGGKLA